MDSISLSKASLTRRPPKLSWLQWVLQLLQGNKPTREESLNGIVPIPGPPPVPLIGSVLDVDIDDVIKSVVAIMQEYGPIIQLYTGSKRDVICGSQALANELSDETRFCKVVHGALFHLREASGDGLFTAQHGSHTWGVAHRILLPNFSPLKIHDMFDGMKDIIEQLCLKWARHGPEAPIDAADDFTRLTVDTITLCTMNYRLNSFYLNDDMHLYVKALSRVLVESDKKAQFPDAINAMRFRADSRYKADIEDMAKICRNIIRQRRAAGPDPNSNILLDLMIHGVDPKTGDKLSEEAIIWNLHTFLVAGHDTTSGMLSFAFCFLLENPDKMRKAREEVDSVLREGETMTLKHLQKLPYLDAILKETLRLHAPAPGFYVRPLKDTEIIGGKYVVHKSDPIAIILHQLHRDPEVWGDDADEFKPERMEHDKFSNLPPNSWKPFGNGVRSCIGRAFAWQESLMVMAILLQHFDFEMDDPSYTLRVQQTLTLKPGGFKMRARLRHSKKSGDLFKGRADVASQSVGLAGNRRTKTSNEPGHPMTILYGSNTGTGEALARWLADDAAAAGFEAQTVVEMNAATQKLPKGQPIVIIAASYNGSPSENAEQFVEWLQNLPPKTLEGVSYCVFGLGHRDWVSTHNKVPILINELMEKAGATRLTDPKYADMATEDLFSSAESWSAEQLWPVLGDKYAVKPTNTLDVDLQVEESQPARLTMRRGFFQATVTETRELSRPGVPRKHHLGLKLPADIDYHTGDRLQVLPKNGSNAVNRVLSRFSLDHDQVLTINSARPLGLPVGMPISAVDLVSMYVELGQPASQRNIRTLIEFVPAADEATKAALLDLAVGRDEADTKTSSVSVLDILERFRCIDLPFAKFLAMLPQMRPRTYSLSSSPARDPQHGTLTLSVSDEGVATNYLASAHVGQFVHASLVRAPREFRLPSSPSSTPVVMIATGSGLAPFRGFLQERSHTKGGRLAPALLFYGCRGPADDMYRAELDEFERAGVVEVRRAFSREPGAPYKYVTDNLSAAREDLARVWAAGAAVYVCGGKKISDNVFDVLGPILFEADRKAAKTSAETVDEWSEQLPRERYVMEIFN